MYSGRDGANLAEATYQAGMNEIDSFKSDRRDAAAIAACVGIPTETLERIAALPVIERPAALVEAATRQAKKFRSRP